ncbi:MAG: OmpA family protein [Bacteroidia bacterium]
MKANSTSIPSGIQRFILFAFLLLAGLLHPFQGNAQDVEGCKDHELLTRVNNFYISKCEENYNEVEVRTSASKTERMEGNLFTISYAFNFDAGEKMKAPLQIIKNYENAIVNNGGKLIYKNTNSLEADIEATLYLSTKEKEYWIRLGSFGGNGVEVERYVLYVLEIEAMKQEVDASKMFEAINATGFVALDIHFETGKSTIKPESQAIVKEIAAMLQHNPGLKVSVEGHTDNVGTPQSNLTLSEARAKAVVDALSAEGIDKARLQSKGWGQTKPVADNGTEEGKAKNRRVEIVKR